MESWVWSLWFGCSVGVLLHITECWCVLVSFRIKFWKQLCWDKIPVNRQCLDFKSHSEQILECFVFYSKVPVFHGHRGICVCLMLHLLHWAVLNTSWKILGSMLWTTRAFAVAFVGLSLRISSYSYDFSFYWNCRLYLLFCFNQTVPTAVFSIAESY